MRGKSHLYLGQYLIDRYILDATTLHRTLFLFGCIQPDINPLTYLKGSLRCQLFRGHNYRNARRFMRRISFRLEKRDAMHLMDYYTLGKLIHYTADTFTYAHNDCFSKKISDHRKYEAALQKSFLKYLQQNPKIDTHFTSSIMESIRYYYSEYSSKYMDIDTDCEFALQACCCVLTVLFTKGIL